MYTADFSLPTAPPKNNPLASTNSVSGTNNGKTATSSPNSGFGQLLEQKGLAGNILEQLIPSLPTSDSALEITIPQQDLAALFLLNPQFSQMVTLNTDSVSSPALLQQTVQPGAQLLNPMQSNPASVQSLQTDVTPASLLQSTKAQPLASTQISAESFSLQKQVPQTESLIQPVGNDVDADVFTHTNPNSKPLFQNVDEIPVKVGDMPSLDAQASDFPQKLGNELSKALSHGDQTLSLRLAPAELGTITVEMTRSHDGTLQVLLKASSAAATNLLSDRAADLGGILRNSTQSPVYVEVQQADSSQYQQQQGSDRQHSQQQQQQQQSHTQQQSQDFLEQLRLGLVSLDPEAS